MVIICPITYTQTDGKRYSEKGLKSLSRILSEFNDFPYDAKEQRQEAMNLFSKMSIQGVQPKLSVLLNTKKAVFEITPINGQYILKPPHIDYEYVPENEDLTMRLAKVCGVEVPLHGLIYCKGGSLTYFIKRFDRIGKGKKLAVEDFAQLAKMVRDTKYDYSMEKLIKLIDDYCTFPVIEKMKIFRLVIFNFLVGNEDMHLKNYSVISRNGKIELSPAYDLLNTTIIIKNVKEEIALPINGKKSNLNYNLLVNYFGKERLQLTDKVINQVLNDIEKSFPIWLELIDKSFLSYKFKIKYKELISKRASRLNFTFYV